MKCVLVLGMLVTLVLGKSIDNPAETPDRPGGMKMAVPTVVETAKREGKSLAVPPPVQVTSGVVTVLGDARKGRVIEIGDDGIPIIHGVRVPDDPSDTKVYRNARIVNNVLITPEDEVKMNGVRGRSLSDASDGDRTARILTAKSPGGDGTSGSWIFKDDRPQAGTSISLQAKGSSSSAVGNRGARQYPEFYYRKYYNNERVGVIAESSFDDNLSTSSEQVVSYSYLAAPEGNSRGDSSTSSSNDVVYGSGAAAKPPAQSVSASISLEPAQAAAQVSSRPIIQLPQLQQQQQHQLQAHQQSFQPSLAVIGSSSSNEVSTSLSNAVPFGHETTPAESFAIHQVPSNGQAHFHQQLITHPPHAPPTVIAADHNNFIIQDTTFQAHPGAPTFSLPIPIPTQQAKPIRRRPFHRNQIQASSDAVHHAVPATDFSYTHYNPYVEPETKKPIYKKIMEPFMKAGEKIYEMASPVLDPMINAGQRFSQNLGLQASESSVPGNNYISRTVDGGTLPIVAGVAVLAAVSIGALALAASSNITLGKRSVDDPMEEFMYQVLDPYPMGEPTLLDHLEQYTSWTDSKCSKRIFCDVMSNIGDDTLYTVEKRLDMFLRLLNRGSAEESKLKRTADDVMQAVYRRDCGIFSCGGNNVDSSQVSRLSSGPR